MFGTDYHFIILFYVLKFELYDYKPGPRNVINKLLKC